MENNFYYDSENHKGYVGEKLIPSVTQLLEILYPLGNVPAEKLQQASEYGTMVHEDIEMVANGLADAQTSEGKNFEKLCALLHLKVIETEKQVLFRIDGEIVAYGTYDGLFECQDYIVIRDKQVVATEYVLDSDKILYEKGAIILYDNKTVYEFDNAKVGLQTSLYALAETRHIDNVAGVWVRKDLCQLRPLHFTKGDNIKIIFNDLLLKWRKENEKEN